MNSGFLLSISNYKKILQKIDKWGGKLDLDLHRIRQLDNALQNTYNKQKITGKLSDSLFFWGLYYGLIPPQFLFACVLLKAISL